MAIALPTVAFAANAPGDRVVAMYFHRTQRCPTCQKMGGYSEEAVKDGFADQINDGTVAFYYVDFQDPKNGKLAKGYEVSGPALIVAKIKGKKVQEFKDLEDIWTNVADKQAFIKYVQENVSAYID
jgi:Zn-dependent alcohol dehydrogenase